MALTELRNCKLIDLTKLSNHKLLRCKNVKYRPEFAALCRDCVKRPRSKKIISTLREAYTSRHNGAAIEGSVKPLGTMVHVMFEGYQEGPLMGPQWCRDTPVSRKGLRCRKPRRSKEWHAAPRHRLVQKLRGCDFCNTRTKIPSQKRQVRTIRCNSCKIKHPHIYFDKNSELFLSKKCGNGVIP